MDNTRGIRFILVMVSATVAGVLLSMTVRGLGCGIWVMLVVVVTWCGCGYYTAKYVFDEGKSAWPQHIIAGAGAPFILCLVLISDPSKMTRIKRFFSKKV